MTTKSGVSGKTVPQLHRAEAAEKRKAAREGRSSAEQLVELGHRPGGSRRERARLS